MKEAAIAALGSQTRLKNIIQTLENQTREIFRGDYNAQSASITTCLENLGQLILKEPDYLYELQSFIKNGVCYISRNYESAPETVTPAVLNFLMTAIRSYNHIISTSGHETQSQYRVALDECHGLSDISESFLTQVLIPHIDAGALHVFPADDPLVFDIKVKKSFITHSPSPLHGNRPGSLATPVLFGKALTSSRRLRRRMRRARAAPGETASNSDSAPTGSSSDGDGSNGGARRKPSSRRVKKNVQRRSIRRVNKKFI